MHDLTNATDRNRELSPADILKSPRPEAIGKFNSLSETQQLELILQADGYDRLELLRLSPHYKNLVQALPPPEVLFTIEVVGADACLPFIAATNFDQFTFLTDLLCWDQEALKPEAIGEWLQILVNCGEEKIQEWLTSVDSEWLILILKTVVNVYKGEIDSTPPSILEGENIFTLDEMYYFECPDPKLAAALKTLLTILRTEDAAGFRGIMESVLWMDRLEVELDAAQFRQSRLAEWGFPDLDEAREIYQYLTPNERRKILQTAASKHNLTYQQLIVPNYPAKFQERRGFLTAALAFVTDRTRRARFNQELMLLANKVQVADGMKSLGGLESIIVSSRKTMGYVTLGLAGLSLRQPEKAAEFIGRIHTLHLFQVGFSQIRDLQRQAQQLVHRAPGLLATLAFGDRQILTGLLNVQPQFYIGDQKLETHDFEDFHEPEQLQKCRELLQSIETQGSSI
ncbi:DUF6178 family protein [candidate division KSB1 bacterium]|nr:DUF6178 family protein [candidate division KSB1 bacterium]